MKRIAAIYSVLILLSATTFGQVNSGLLTTLSAVAGMRDRFPVEKLYLQLDKPYYSLGDTLRFKAYLLNGDFLKPSLKSGILYVELDDAANKMAIRMSVPLVSGIGWGNMALAEKDIPEGSYTLRAYTNWMLNFGEDYIFKKTIYISPVNGGSTLVKAGFKLESGADKDKVTAAIQLSSLNGQPLRLKDMKLRVNAGNKTLFRDKANTGMDGTMRLNFDLPDKTAIKNLAIIAQQTGKGTDTATLTIPVTLNRVEKTDVQFMPEGGNMVSGIATKIGFKAISEDGKGTEVTGKIVNSKQQEVAAFASTHKGMGSFELTPQAGEIYTAKVNAPNNTLINYALPAVNATGTALKIVPKGNDSLEVTITATADLLNASANYYLIGETRGLVCYTALISFKNQVIKKVVAKDLFPAGIAHFTLLNSANQALNERIVYIAHNETLHINLTASQPNYALRDSIAVSVQVKNKDGKPVRGSFSLAVTDDAQVSTDSLNNNITSYLLLTSDLKGNIEEPGWYFQKDTPEQLTALDNLLLTQGWVGYDWKAIFNPIIQQPKYRAEPEFVIQGKVTNIFNKPLKQTGVTLLQKQPSFAMETQTDNEGRFIFRDKNLFPTDTAYYLIQAKNKREETSNVGVDLDEFIPPIFATPKQRLLPWYFNSDTTLLNNAATKMAQLKAEAAYRGEGQMLKEVVIKEKKIIPGSHNMRPDLDFLVLDETVMNAAKKLTLAEVLKKQFKGFYRGPTFGNRPPRYFINTDNVFLQIDATPVFPPDLYMDYITAEDIRGIEFIQGVSYVHVIVTTYSDKGKYLKHIAGRYVYKPVPLSLPKQFYSPKYTAKNRNIAMGTDLRSTIYWVPNLITDKDGKATVSFYSADMPTDYTLILEGTDMNGSFGYSRQKIKVAVKR